MFKRKCMKQGKAPGILVSTAAVILLSNVWGLSSYAAPVQINETNFPDDNFRSYITMNLDDNEDGWLDATESAITNMSCSSLNIADLKGIEHFTALEVLFCEDNHLTSLDVSSNSALQQLNCDDNQLTFLNLGSNPVLENVVCRYNQLTSMEMGFNPALKGIYCDNNPLNVLDVSMVPFIKDAVLNGIKDTSDPNYDLYSSSLGANLMVDKANITIFTGVEINDTNFPDANFRSYITTNRDGNSDGWLDTAELAETYMSCSSLNIADLKGIEHFKALKVLDCEENGLTSLDMGSNPALNSLFCRNNQLTSLDVSSNPALERLGCEGNQLTSLNVSSNLALEKLWCEDNQLTSLDVSSNPVLKELWCYKNQLTSLDVQAVPLIKDAVVNGTKDVSDPNYDGYESLQGKLRVDKTVNIVTGVPIIHTVSFDVKGHGTAPAVQTVVNGSVAAAPAEPSESGWIFGGWYTEEGFVNVFDFTTPIIRNITLYAKWAKIDSGGGSGSSGGGGSSRGGGGFRGTTAVGGSTLGLAFGTWKQDAKGWWYQYSNGSYSKNEWKQLPYSGGNAWYAFDEAGYLRTGWFMYGGQWYYLSVAQDASLGKMLTGWQEIGGKWYYLESTGNAVHPQGAMYANEKTSDGYTVGADGVWVN